MSNPQQQTITAANALSGEKSFRRVEFAVTGDLEIDLMSGILAVLDKDPHDYIRGSINIRVLQYLLDREKAIERDHERKCESEKRQMENLRQMLQLGSIGQGLNPPMYPSPNPFLGDYTTSGGTVPPQANLANDQMPPDIRAQMNAIKAEHSRWMAGIQGKS